MTAFGYKQAGDMIDISHPMGRSGTPQDIAGCLLFFTSRAAAHVTGAHLVLDGGMMISGDSGLGASAKL